MAPFRTWLASDALLRYSKHARVTSDVWSAMCTNLQEMHGRPQKYPKVSMHQDSSKQAVEHLHIFQNAGMRDGSPSGTWWRHYSWRPCVFEWFSCTFMSFFMLGFSDFFGTWHHQNFKIPFKGLRRNWFSMVFDNPGRISDLFLTSPRRFKHCIC
jgi:hypothetical protein